MRTNGYKTAAAVLFALSVAVTAAHFLWTIGDEEHALDLGGFLLNVLPYGLPILTYALAWRALRREEARWCMADTVLGILFTLSFLAMAVHVTAAGALQGMADVYFNLPVVYAIPLSLLALVWLAVRLRPQAEASVAKKVLFALPVLPLAAMAVHCGILCVTELSRESLAGSAPWWTLPLVFALLYLIGAALLVAVYAIYCAAARHRQHAA